MTPAEFDQFCEDICPHCKAGKPLRQRTDTREWTHDFASGPNEPKTGRPFLMGHALCYATFFRDKYKDQLGG